MAFVIGLSLENMMVLLSMFLFFVAFGFVFFTQSPPRAAKRLKCFFQTYFNGEKQFFPGGKAQEGGSRDTFFQPGKILPPPPSWVSVTPPPRRLAGGPVEVVLWFSL